MSATGFQTPPVDSNALLRDFIQRHYPSAAEFRAALSRYGITENDLKQRLAWEVTLLRFTDQRFKPLAALAESQTADRLANPAQPSPNAVDQQMDTWLAQQR